MHNRVQFVGSKLKPFNRIEYFENPIHQIDSLLFNFGFTNRFSPHLLGKYVIVMMGLPISFPATAAKSTNEV